MRKWITLVPSADMSVAIGKDGKTFTVIAPIETEPTEWDTKMARGFQRGGTNQL
ncbi:MAG: hypothetical protein K2X93_25175 [Candidatus Obscuribacterales bacterium]|nr:hypothetical protein [Candidatus Obscuribacterales bacterium]